MYAMAYAEAASKTWFKEVEACPLTTFTALMHSAIL